MKPPKFYRTALKDGRTICPWCGTINNHRTGKCCEHVHKVTAQGVVFYWWGERPLKQEVAS